MDHIGNSNSPVLGAEVSKNEKNFERKHDNRFRTADFVQRQKFEKDYERNMKDYVRTVQTKPRNNEFYRFDEREAENLVAISKEKFIDGNFYQEDESDSVGFSPVPKDDEKNGKFYQKLNKSKSALAVYDFSLDGNDTHHLFWQIDYEIDTVIFEVHTRRALSPHPWIAVGFSEYGELRGSDMCVLWVDWKGEVHFQVKKLI